MGIETVYSMLTLICGFKHQSHRAEADWPDCTAGPRCSQPLLSVVGGRWSVAGPHTLGAGVVPDPWPPTTDHYSVSDHWPLTADHYSVSDH